MRWRCRISVQGRTRRFDPYVRDVGRMAESNRLEDAYRFRTPMLRNVALTGPWGHNGAYATLEGIVRHHLDPVASLGSLDAGYGQCCRRMPGSKGSTSLRSTTAVSGLGSRRGSILPR
jgi:hypothetical protein